MKSLLIIVLTASGHRSVCFLTVMAWSHFGPAVSLATRKQQEHRGSEVVRYLSCDDSIKCSQMINNVIVPLSTVTVTIRGGQKVGAHFL